MFPCRARGLAWWMLHPGCLHERSWHHRHHDAGCTLSGSEIPLQPL